MRIGQGYDLHKLVPGRDFILGGVKIPHTAGLLGHSDADVLTHAIIDAILGAIADGDIGRHFPDTDPAYKNADSLKLLAQTGDILKEKGYRLINIDSTVIAERPKLAPYVNKMRENIALALKIDPDAVSIKAKTNEGMDSAGKEEAVQAQAVVLIETL